MPRLTRPLVFLLAPAAVLALALSATATEHDPGGPRLMIVAKPDPVVVGDTVRLVGRNWPSGGRCVPRVRLSIEELGKRPIKIGTARVKPTPIMLGPFVFKWRVRDLIGNKAQTHGRLLGLKINGQATCHESVGTVVIGESGEMTTIGASIRVAPAFPSIGDTLRVRGRDWASPENCDRRVRLSLRRGKARARLGRAPVRKHEFSFSSQTPAVQPADDWAVLAVQRCKDGRKRFAIKRRMGPIQIHPAPEPPAEGPLPPEA